MNRLYKNGWNAAVIHLNAEANPFPAGSKSYKDWRIGWEDAKAAMTICQPRIEHAN